MCGNDAVDPCAGGAECNQTCTDTGADTFSCFDPTTVACTDDGNPCTDDFCDGAGGCVNDSSACVCVATPEPDGSCNLATALGAGKSSIRMKNKSLDTKDQLKWKWNKGVSTIVSDFKSPDSSSNTYRVCLYDITGLLREMDLPPGGLVPTCDGKDCWKVTGSGFKYKNKTGSPDGITGAKFKASTTPGKSQVQVKTKGKGGFYSSPATLGLIESVVIQLLIDDGITIECFKTTFSTFTRKDAENYKAKGP